jgi:hypothetical protein
MPRITYVPKNFRDSSLEIIQHADEICSDYAARGFNLTLRQLYYQFVARGLLANKQTNYDRLGSIVNDARLAGLMDWDHLEDRTRSLYGLPTVGEPGDLLRQNVWRYRTDWWQHQDWHLEVWVEKQALESVIAGAANQRQVDYFSCRGYVSQSEMWAAAQRLIGYSRKGYKNVIIHLGDHDPSGIDMTRDNEDRLELFGAAVEVRRIALNMDQVEQHNPPPNPAKLTDSRVDGYIERFGHESWELDALDPETLTALITDTIDEYIEPDQWAADLAATERGRQELESVSDNWAEVSEFLRDNGYLS